jgi:Lon protease-like protein
MFPLGSVLFPHMPLPLRIFEERYLVMLADILGDEPSEFGVVLIERGQEVGGGEQRFKFGTVAQIATAEVTEGFVGLIAQGERRIEVIEWLDDAPYPKARVRELEEFEWSDDLQPLREKAEHLVRRTLAMASEFSDQMWSSTVELSEDPVAAAWQLAGIAPVGPLDQMSLVCASSVQQLLELVIEYTEATNDSLQSPWPDE